MMHMTGKGTLIIGVEYDGRVHRDFEMRPPLFRDTVEILDNVEGIVPDSWLFKAHLMAKTLIKLGDIPEKLITSDLVMDLHDTDAEAIMMVQIHIEKRVRRFRGGKEDVQESGAGTHEGGLPAGEDSRNVNARTGGDSGLFEGAERSDSEKEGQKVQGSQKKGQKKK